MKKENEFKRETTFEIIEVFKGDLKPGSTLVVATAEPLEIDLYENEEVIWYLTQKSLDGRQAPIGVVTGDFRIRQYNYGKLTSNLSRNQGLWGESGTLWSSLNEKELARQYLLKRQIPKDLVERILSIGEGPCCPEELPIDIILAATYGKLASASSQK